MRRNAMIGGAVWLALVAVFGPGRGFFRTIELMFLIGPLVIVPLGLALMQREPVAPGRALPQLLNWLQPIGAMMAVVAFAFPTGWPAATLATPWLAVTVLIGWAGLMRVRRGEFRDPVEACLIAAMLFVPVGGIGFVQSRFGAAPLGYVEPVVLLVGVHFHFTGFALPILAGMTLATGKGTWLERLAASGVIGATPVVALGFIFRWPLVKVAGASWLVISVLVLSCLMLAGLRKVRPWFAQMLVAASALSVMAGMALAGVYAVGEFLEKDWLIIPQMALTHGILNGLGFCLCGLIGWLLAGHTNGNGIRSLTRRW